METAENMAAAFEAEAGSAPVVNVSGVDAPAVTSSNTIASNQFTGKFYTEEDLAKVRSQEKDKLYPQIESLKEELNSLRKEKEEATMAKDAEAQALAEKAKAEALAELDAKSYADTRLTELQEQLERERQERERAFALLEREKTFADLQNYRAQRLDQERENIIPELIDLITGNTQEEIESSIAGLKDRSARILESAQSAMQNARKEMTGTRVTAPSAGPLDTNSEQRQFSAEDIQSMSLNDYAKYRDRLLSATARGKSRGLFG